ncbi:hypothetical protein J1N35_007103 [Gossypium stocksii]|uniref:Uncharacterized protein n=1 Tax=Gossypium stocksii TaxID=47602 RepID=A0A9D3W8I2_9ROSI|nr:hypothetical protein J1N35_007103 [Gossypium stocksii]
MHKIFGTTPIRVSSIKYRFCHSVDPVTYDSFDIKGGRSLERWCRLILLVDHLMLIIALPTGVVVAVARVVVPPARVVVVGVGRMTHLDRIKNTELFASPTAEVIESHKVMEIGNGISSSIVPRAIPPTMVAYISPVESESLGNEMH